MVIERAEGVGYVEPVVPGVEGPVEVRVCVHGAVDEVLPCVDEEGCEGVLECRDKDVVEEFGEGHVQR